MCPRNHLTFFFNHLLNASQAITNLNMQAIFLKQDSQQMINGIVDVFKNEDL